ncbi:MAG TPA: hypothetical protein VH500_12205 [Nitrososphaeraceae archaeon]|jgi:hypothetical protein
MFQLPGTPQNIIKMSADGIIGVLLALRKSPFPEYQPLPNPGIIQSLSEFE